MKSCVIYLLRNGIYLTDHIEQSVNSSLLFFNEVILCVRMILFLPDYTGNKSQK